MDGGDASPSICEGQMAEEKPKKHPVSGHIHAWEGYNNDDIERSFRRVISGDSWRNQRCVAIIPASRSIPTLVALSHWSLLAPPNQPFVRMAAIGMEVGEAYSQGIGGIIHHPEMGNWEYILTLEHDNMPPPDGLLKLIKRIEKHPEYGAISGLYWTKGLGGMPQIWGDPTDPIMNYRPIKPVVDSLVECNAIGMGFAIWRMSMLKDKRFWVDAKGNMKLPFKTLDQHDNYATQDIAFWMEAKKYGYRCAVDCAVKVGHYDQRDEFIW
jgi:hypothetical protein